MLQLRKKILVGILCAAMVLSASQSVAWSETAEVTSQESTAETETAETAEAVEEEATEDKTKEEEVVPVTEEQALAECKISAENDQLALYLNETTGAFAIKVKENGYIWWSNPYQADTDPVAGKNTTKKEALKSSLMLNVVSVTDTETSPGPVYSYTEAVKNNKMKIDPVENGFKATYEFTKEGITIPYYVTLNGDHVDVRIAVNEIVEKELTATEDTTTEDTTDESASSYRSIIDVNLLSDFGAGRMDEEGYIITPDGSGAVINFNNGKTKSREYSQRLYGRDLAISQDKAPKKTEQAYLPVMGIVKEDNALMAVVTQGSAYATANATVSGQKATSYNSAWFNFTLRPTDSYYMGGQNAAALKAYDQNIIPEESLQVSYYPIAEKDADYVDVALRYQKYLVEEKGMTKKASSENAPLYLDIYGGTVKQRSVMGFPVNLETAATTYEQAKTILQEFSDLGVGNMVVTYNDFNKAGITSRISNGVGYSSTLGGKAEFEKLKQYCDGLGITLAPSVDLMEYERSGNGYTKTGASCISVTKAYATQTPYELAFGTPHDTRSSWYILTPAYYGELYGKVLSSYQKEGMSAISVADGTNILYSDFTANTNRRTSRQQALEYLKACYALVNTSGLTFVAGASNDYALPYVDHLKDVPLYSSNFDIYDYDIPFYEIVIHGYIPYTTKAKNASSSADELFIYSVATGTPLHYEVMYEDPNEFTDCEYDTLFYSYYAGWLQTAAGEYKLVQDHVKGLVDETITDFKYLDDNKTVVQTTFSDGTIIEADLDELTLKVNGTEINLADYGLKGATTN